MIRSFRSKHTERLFRREPVRRWGPDVQRAALRKLRMLNAAATLEDLRAVPGNRLEKLVGDRSGEWSIRVDARWRLCSRWENGGAFGVDLVDYH